jgi:Txe/YoeB family toxin of Txe-Axe toxin-antitoxin module
VSYEVIFEPSAEEDLRQIATVEPRVAKAALDIAKNLRDDPYLGDEMRKRPRLELLADCRRIRFDESSRRGKPRYRLVYRNEPSDGAPHIVAILAIGERTNLQAYRDAVKARVARPG